jgi:ubiquinone/menaquinone biosynthesis C-methylase UbiE
VYFFGLYHWRVRLKRLLRALAVGAVALAVGRSRSRWRQAVGVLGVGWALHRGRSALDALCSPAPWVVERYKYEALARVLPTDGAESWLDVGCGTGRSFVGFSDLVPDSCRVVGLDVFDDRVVLGNGPRLAARNATKAGLDAAMVRGDAARVPVAAGSQDVVTACRLLHDLPREDALATLSDLYRACAPGGAVGVLEIPITHDGRDEDPAAYWPSLVAEAGFDVKTVEEVPRRRSDDAYVVVVGLAG